MKKHFLITLTLLCHFIYCQAQQAGDFTAIEKGFISPPESTQTACYWYWLNDHISEEGVIKDLQAMKKAGINRAFIGTNIRNRTSFSRDLTGQYFGDVKFFSDEWWQVLQTALKTASDLNIEIGIFNCPGWSQSGGPWIKPEQAMRYIEASELRVKGPGKISQHLAKPDTFFQDVKVLAIPVAPAYEQNLLSLSGTKLTPSNLQAHKPSALNPARYILSEKEAMLTIELPKISTIRSLTFYTTESMSMKVDFQVKEKDAYKTIRSFSVSRSQTAENLAKGFEPYAPYALSVDEVKGKSFRLLFQKNGETDSQFSNIVLSSTPVIKDLPEKKLATVQSGLPAWGAAMWETQTQPDTDIKMPQAAQVLDISRFMSPDGTLNWKAPKGEWLIMRTGMRFIDVQNGPASFEAEGLEADKINKKHIKSHFDAFIGEILKRVPAQDRKNAKSCCAG